jgi:hypothetical protein
MTKEVFSVFDQIVQEWNQWMSSPRGTQTLARWASDDDAFEGWGAAELRAPRSSPRTDRMQAAVLRRVQGGEHGAVLTMITQLRPGLITLARWWQVVGRGRLESPADADAEVLTTFGEVMMGHDLDRRPDKIAANLLLDTRQRLWRATTRRSRSEEAAQASATIDHRPPQAAPEEVAMELDLTQAVTTAIGQLPGSPRSRRLTAELAYRAWILEQPRADIARDLGVGPNTVRTRLCRLRNVVREVQAQAA